MRWLVVAGLALAACGDDAGSRDVDVTTTDVATSPDIGADVVADVVADVITDAAAEVGPDVAGDVDDVEGDSVASDADTEAAAPAACGVDFDCEGGLVCVLSQCVAPRPACSETDGCEAPESCLEGVCVGEGESPDAGRVVIAELLADGSADGDPNGDGTLDAVEDELVELVNVSNTTVDLGGWTLVESGFDTGLPRHTFAAGTTLAPRGAIVIFGGGDPPDPDASVLRLTANAADPGIAFGLDLDDAGDVVRLLDADGRVVTAVAYGPGSGVAAASDTSLVRSPELTGPFVPHDQVALTAFSPGTRADGSPF